MSEPREKLDSGDHLSRIKSRFQLWIWGLGVLAMLTPPMIYIAQLPTQGNVDKIIKAQCVSREEYAAVRGEVRANSRHLIRIERKLDRNGNKLDQILLRRVK